MKNKILFLAILVFTLFGPNVYAKTVTELKAEDTKNENITVEGENNNYTLQLTSNATEDIVISEGEVVTLNLGEFNLTSNTFSAIEVKEKGTLIIEGTGTITNADVNYPVIGNKGALTINGGIIESKKVGHTGILNDEEGTLTITNGTVKTSVDGAWGITNKGTATISGGTFTQGRNFSIILNAGGTMTIEDGLFNTEGEGPHYSLLTNTSEDEAGGDTLESTLNIEGGIFKSEKTLSQSHLSSDITISGGEFQEQETVSAFLDSNFEFDESGKVVVKPELEPEEKPTDEKKPSESNPKTGDNLMTYITIAVGALVCIVVLILILKKLNK